MKINRERIHEIIFEADTREGKIFDIALLIAILLSVTGVILESVADIHESYGKIIFIAEWIFTILFTIEYILRIYSINKPVKYIFSFFGIIDLLSILPTYLMFIFPPLYFLVDIRVLRLLRMFRVLKLSRHIRGANVMQIALRSSRPKIIVFLLTIIVLLVVLGTLMYIVEGLGAGTNGFEDIPNSMYWALVTLTTVGFGNVFPVTIIGKFIASIIMMLGYAIIAVPTGIVTAGIIRNQKPVNTKACMECSQEGHENDASHCKYCGAKLD